MKIKQGFPLNVRFSRPACERICLYIVLRAALEIPRLLPVTSTLRKALESLEPERIVNVQLQERVLEITLKPFTFQLPFEGHCYW